MSPRAALIAFGSVVAAGLIALLIAAGGDQRASAFSLDVPNATPITILGPSETACQGPFDTLVAFKGVRAWLAPAGLAVLDVVVRDQSGRRVARGVIQTQPALGEVSTSTLDATIRSGTRVSVCLHNRGPSNVGVIGSTATASSGPMRVGSKPTADAIALVLLRPRPRTLLSLVPTIFARAALFKASWVGSWTFWGLCAALLGAFALTGVAVAQAVRDEVSRDDP